MYTLSMNTNKEERRLNLQLKYGYCVDTIVGRHLVDGGLADTRAVKINQALRDLFSACGECDERNLKILADKFPWILETANKFSHIENEFEKKVSGTSFNKTFDQVLGGKND
jgi:hypothetical protein